MSLTPPLPDPPDAQHLVVPGTGEVVSLNAPTDMLADVVLQARGAERELRELRRQVEAELQARMHAAQRSTLYGEHYEVRFAERNEAVWDADELEAVLRELRDAGTLHEAEATDVITHETKVSKSAAGRLVKSLRGAARQRVEACRHWQKSYGAVEVIRAVPADLGAALEASVDDR